MTLKIKKGSAQFIRAYDQVEQIENWWANHPEAIGLAVVGRSNVGKSSIINSLFGNKTAKTSKTPGRTQKINIFTFELEKDEVEGRKYFLYDLPGYGFAQVNKSMGKNWKYMMDAFLSQLNGRTLLLNLQDARHPDQSADQGFYSYINPKVIEIFLIFNKMDKLKRQKERAALNKVKPRLMKDYKHVKQIFFVSAESKEGLEGLELSLISYLKKMDDVTDLMGEVE